ncbi:MAG: ribosome-associated translation inhibitor RaiA [Verrucomicrobia bacterium]|nr:ribosome-associated translation inhibitor RaiA [Verrucomicrobiota bacterium]
MESVLTGARMGRSSGTAINDPRRVSLDFVRGPEHHPPMNLILSTHNVTLTKAIEDHIMDRIRKLEHLDRFAIDVRVTLEHDHKKIPERAFKCTMRLTMPGPDLFAEDSERDLYAAIDLVTKKIEQQIRKRHNKYKARKHTLAAQTKRKRQEAGIQ